MILDPLKENLLRRAVIGDLVTRSADRFRDRIFLMTDKEKISYRTLNEKSRMAANAFMAMGIKRGDRVAFMTHNCLAYLYCYFGLAKIGAVSVPLNFMLKGEEIAYIIGDAEPKAFFVEDSVVDTVLGAKDRLKGIEHFGWINFGAKPKPEGWIDVG
ncbi:MAG: AMP-binding protein, partial [Syntrophales bacterium]|nr:AMP-binding protein [Syntrophales bacterium]